MTPGFSAHGIGIEMPGYVAGFRAISAAGFRRVDLRLRDLAESAIPSRSILAALADNGLTPGTCPFPVDWRDGRIGVGDVIEKLGPLIDYAVDIGIERLYARVCESVPDGRTAEETLDDHRQKLLAIANRLAKAQISLAIETVGVESFRGGRAPLLPTLADVRTRLSDCFAACPNLGLLVDAFHLHAAAESVAAAVGPAIDRVFGIHVADLPGTVRSRSEILDHERALPATTGQVPVRAILAELDRLGCPAGIPVIVETLKCPQNLVNQPFGTIAEAVFASLTEQLVSEN